MRWQTLQAQLERALATAEATLSLLREQLSLQEARRESDREWLETCRREDAAILKAAFANLHEKVELQARGFSEGQGKVAAQIEALREVAGIPTRDIPTVEELIDEARTDGAKRKLLQHTLAELEFENTEVDFN